MSTWRSARFRGLIAAVQRESDELIVVYVTAPEERAVELAGRLVKQRVAACVNVLPRVRSIYRWEGQLEDSDEALLIIKAPRAGFDALERAVRALHPYEIPEIIAVPVVAAHAPYAAWVAENCRVEGDAG
jgi:periplasmic divalent cation tolerance protein